jgi:hypothetical protein
MTRSHLVTLAVAIVAVELVVVAVRRLRRVRRHPSGVPLAAGEARAYVVRLRTAAWWTLDRCAAAADGADPAVRAELPELPARVGQVQRDVEALLLGAQAIPDDDRLARLAATLTPPVEQVCGSAERLGQACARAPGRERDGAVRIGAALAALNGLELAEQRLHDTLGQLTSR